jgi:hypothetical protein
MSRSIDALRSANPRRKPDFEPAVHAAAHAVRARIARTAPDVSSRPRRYASPRLRHVRASVAGVSVAAATGLIALFLVVSPAPGPGVESAAAAVEKAAAVTATSADLSGTVIVRMTHNSQVWAASTIHWHGADISVSQDTPDRQGRIGSKLLVIDGTVYGIDEDGGWVAQGSPDNIDPDSGTTPDEDLAAVREDVGGVTLRRITDGMSGLTTTELDDGSSVYSGTVEAGLFARESGFKGGQPIRVLPFGYVAQDEAADPASPLDVAVTVAADGIVREIAVTWGTSASAWTYTVAYSRLGDTPAPVAPANARDLLKERLGAD